MSNTTATKTTRTRRTVAKPAPVEVDTDITTAADTAPKGYLQTKAPSELHVDLAAYIEEQTGLVVSPKAVQAVLGLHPEYQRSDRNKARQAYRPRIKDAAPVATPQPVQAQPKAATATKAQPAKGKVRRPRTVSKITSA